MAVSGDITIAQDGGQANVKLHPYLVTLVRWCVSSLWSTATVLLHRLMTTPLQPITGPKPPLPPKPRIPKRVAGTEHLHPEPRVECQLLHQPEHHTMDVIFVHGLYGSLGNTWRQGEWRLKYKADPQKVPLRIHSTPNTCICHENSYNGHIHNDNKCDDNITDLNDPEMSLKKINEKLSKKVIPKENDLITEQFYNNTLLDQVEIVDNYDTQAKFVRDLFKKENNCDINCDGVEQQYNRTKLNSDYKCDYNESDNDFKCKYNEVNEFSECKCISNEKKCEIGCGCVCNDCYSGCWPRDWIKVDFPGARIISINYTSDPYLWRPLWIKENKRLNLYQRAEQMMEQLLEMGVGEKPIIWVGHSKGGLFIKQIYCEAYEAYMKANKNSRTSENHAEASTKKPEETPNEIHNGITAENIDTIIGHFSHNDKERNSLANDNYTGKSDNYTGNNDIYRENIDNYTMNDIYTENINNYTMNSAIYTENSDNYTINKDNNMNNDNIANNNSCVMHETIKYENVFEQIAIAKNESANNDNLEYINIINDNKCNLRNGNGLNGKLLKETDLVNENEDLTSSIEEAPSIAGRARLWSCSRGFMFYSVPHRGSPLADIKTPVTARSVDLLEIAKGMYIAEAPSIAGRARLWSCSRGFMFYSVPHRGSPLADIKTPVTARSVDLLEIAKDCPLVLELQARWLRAAYSEGAARVSVRSFVETCRTLMSVLWLRIVSTDSADAGIGVLSGVSVDHREICKPSSRTCLLYTELRDLIHNAVKCKCA